jgi:peptidyl-prolyl cis-trans isomerase SurA
MSTNERGSKTNTRRLARAALLLVLPLGLVYHLPEARADLIDRVVATIDGDPVTLYELKQFAAQDVRTRQLTGVDQATMLDALVTKRIIDKEAAAQGIVVSDEEVDRYIAGIRERNQITEDQLAAALSQQGVGLDEYRNQVREELQRAQLISREIRGKVNVTPEEVERYYEANLKDYETPPQIAVSHIVLLLPPDAPPEKVDEVMKRAEEIHAQLDNGADFSELARKYSEDAAAAGGGKLGTFKHGELFQVLEDAVDKLEPGQYSKPVRSPIGVHIVRLDERSESAHKPLDSLADEIKERLYNAALEERYNRWLREDLRKRHHVEIQL